MAATDEFGEALELFERKLKRLQLDYEQYFLGTRPREPLLLRQELQKFVAVHSQMPITNTGQRFKFHSLCARLQAQKRKWDETNRKIEAGTYQRHQFRARLRQREAGEEEPARGRPAAGPAAGGATGDTSALFERYVRARAKAGLSTAELTPERFRSALARQKAELRKRYGDSDFRFRVVVEDGGVRLKASRDQDAE